MIGYYAGIVKCIRTVSLNVYTPFLFSGKRCLNAEKIAFDFERRALCILKVRVELSLSRETLPDVRNLNSKVIGCLCYPHIFSSLWINWS